MSKKVALLGGAFNPIHNGHLYLASQFQAQFPDISLCFIPSGVSPHKSNLDLASNDDRLAMVELALNTIPLFDPIISSIELDREGLSYTIDTVRALKKKYAEGVSLFLIIGDDLIEGLPYWKSFEELRKEVQFVVAYREDFSSNQIAKIKANYPEFLFLENSVKAFSSTEIREKIAIGEPCDNLAPKPVLDYIYTKELYCANNRNADCKGVFNYMQKHLSPSRMEHCYCVAKEASRLAALYGVSMLSAYQAGFFHDIARSMEREQMVAFGKNYQHQHQLKKGIANELPAYGEDQLILYHAEAGAWLLQEQFGFSDEDFLEAIACHSVGKIQMGNLARIVFVADFTEPGRKFDNRYWYQLAGKVSLNQLVLEVAKANVDFDEKAGRKTASALKAMIRYEEEQLLLEKN